MSSRKVWRGVFALLFVFVTWLTLTPNPDDTAPSLAIARFLAELIFQNAAFADKIAHFLAYAALGGSAALADLRAGGRRSGVILALALYGGALEYLQGAGGVRVAEFADAVANATGALAAFPATLAIERLYDRLRPA